MKCNASTLNDTVQFGSFNKSWLSDNLFIALNNSQQYKTLKVHKIKTSNISFITLHYIQTTTANDLATSQDDPPTHPGELVDREDSEIKNMEQSYDQGKEYQLPKTPGSWSIKVPQEEVPRKTQTRKSQEDQNYQDVSM